MHVNIKKIIIVLLGILLVAIIINYSVGTTIIINGKQIIGIGRYVGAYLALVLLAAVLIIIIPSTFILLAVLLVVFGFFIMLFLPLLPIAFLLLPGVALVGIVYLIYRLVRK